MIRRCILAVAFALTAMGVTAAITPAQSQAAPRLPACANNADDDRDGAADFPYDLGCVNGKADDDETDPPGEFPECADGKDLDGDGKIDFPDDPGCQSAADPVETDPSVFPECGDTIDNDGDGKISYPADKGCVAASDPSERDWACSDGLDNDDDGRFDFPTDLGCAVVGNDGRGPDQIDNDETDPQACNDGRDNDNDGKLDTDTTLSGQVPDPGCTAPSDMDEADPPPGVRPVDPVTGIPVPQTGSTPVTLKVWTAKPQCFKKTKRGRKRVPCTVRFVFTGMVANAPLEARVAIRVRQSGRWHQFRTPRIVGGRFKTSWKLRRSGRKWCFQGVALKHDLAPYKTGKSKTVCRRAR